MQFGGLTALERVSICAADNEFVSIVGPSGCGKSTLLAVLAGLREQTSGRVLVDGTEIDGPGRDRGVVFQNYTLLPWKTVLENVEFGLLDEPMTKPERAAVAREALARVGLEDFETHRPAQLSGGMQQRVAIARSLAYHPGMLLMDEPFGALDALTRRSMQELLISVWEKHRLTVVFITHDIDEAVLLSDRVLVMASKPGRMVAEHLVDLPRPRNSDTLFEPGARTLLREIISEVMEDSHP